MYTFFLTQQALLYNKCIDIQRCITAAWKKCAFIILTILNYSKIGRHRLFYLIAHWTDDFKVLEAGWLLTINHLPPAI